MDERDLQEAATRRYHEIKDEYGLPHAASLRLEGARQAYLRLVVSNPTESASQRDCYSHPRPSDCRTHGRAHIPGHPVLYAGESPQVIIDELGVKAGTWIHIAVFYTPDPVDLTYLFLIHGGFSSDTRWAQYRDQLREHAQRPDQAANPVDISWRLLAKTALLFRTENYQDSSAIAYFWLYEKQLDGIVYPSLRNDEYCNFALSPRFVESSVALYCVHRCRWTGELIELSATGKPTNGGRIEWNAYNQQDWAEFDSGYRFLIS